MHIISTSTMVCNMLRYLFYSFMVWLEGYNKAFFNPGGIMPFIFKLFSLFENGTIENLMNSFSSKHVHRQIVEIRFWLHEGLLGNLEYQYYTNQNYRWTHSYHVIFLLLYCLQPAMKEIHIYQSYIVNT